jgi:hypothetical protein
MLYLLLDCLQLPTPVKVMSMCLNRQGTLLLVNCSDKSVRLYEVRQRQPDAPSYSSEQLKQALEGVEVREKFGYVYPSLMQLLHIPVACMMVVYQWPPLRYQLYTCLLLRLHCPCLPTPLQARCRICLRPVCLQSVLYVNSTCLCTLSTSMQAGRVGSLLHGPACLHACSLSSW